jgi:hypothetical protein
VGESAGRFEAVRAAELALLGPDVRGDGARLRSILHSDFVEIGRSGRRWTRDEIIDALAHEAGRVAPVPDEWAFVEVAPGLVLLTYRISTPTRTSRHASLWDVSGAAPVIRYHQGTVVPAAS